jgi:hypothetical protein
LKNVGSGPNAGTKQVTLDLDPNSSPYRKTSPDVNGPMQPFVANPGLNSVLSGWGSKSGDTWKIGFQAPSLPPSPDGKSHMWVATPTWLFAADFKMITFSHVTVDWRTGKATPTKVPKWVKAPGSCTGAPLSLSVHRARNFR